MAEDHFLIVDRNHDRRQAKVEVLKTAKGFELASEQSGSKQRHFNFYELKTFVFEAVISFYLYYPRRWKSNGTIFGSFLKYRKMAAIIEVSCLIVAGL